MQLCGCGDVSASSEKKLDNEVASEVLKKLLCFMSFWSRECAKDITYHKNVSTLLQIFSLAVVFPFTNYGSMDIKTDRRSEKPYAGPRISFLNMR